MEAPLLHDTTKLFGDTGNYKLEPLNDECCRAKRRHKMLRDGRLQTVAKSEAFPRFLLLKLNLTAKFFLHDFCDWPDVMLIKSKGLPWC